MKQLVLSQMDMTWMPITGLVIFVSLFVGVVLWSRRRGSKEIYEQAAKLPLE